jgi:hypothetical protein
VRLSVSFLFLVVCIFGSFGDYCPSFLRYLVFRFMILGDQQQSVRAIWCEGFLLLELPIGLYIFLLTYMWVGCRGFAATLCLRSCWCCCSCTVFENIAYRRSARGLSFVTGLLIIYGAVAAAVVVAYFHLIVKERKTVVVEHSPLRISFPLAADFGGRKNLM